MNLLFTLFNIRIYRLIGRKLSLIISFNTSIHKALNLKYIRDTPRYLNKI